MPLDNVTSGVTGQLPTDKVQSTTSGVVKKSAPKKLNRTTKDLTDPVIPGQFPADDAPQKARVSTTISRSHRYGPASQHETGRLAPPPPRQAAIYEAALKRPAATTLIVCQMICCGVPLLVFLAGVFVFAAVSILLWAILSLLILGPVLLVTSMMGMSLWGWGWILYGLVKWVDQRFLGGIIARFWLPQTQSESADGEGQPDEEKKDE
ncbi:hypothetical protein N7453_012246 [Penicillium expansum]|nr:hypothetical protein N7453_012246 [Penicillium expansum]